MIVMVTCDADVDQRHATCHNLKSEMLVKFHTGPVALGMFEVLAEQGRRLYGGRHFGLGFILPLIAMLTKESEMMQPDASCDHTMQ